ncbi:MAG: Nudix family hydrolase [Methylomicrobium sp.]
MPNIGHSVLPERAIVHVAVGAVVDRQRRVLLAKRPDGKHQGGLWEFPGGKIEPGETVEQALQREFREEVGIDIRASEPLITIHHDYPDLSVRLHVRRIERFSGLAHGREGQPIEWAAFEALSQYAFPAANRPIVSALRLPPFYAILDDRDPARLWLNFEKMLDNGIELIQLRLKLLSQRDAAEFVERARKHGKNRNVALLVNSAVPGALSSNSDGVHLTSRDLMRLNERPTCNGWLAASCHNEAELRHAEKIGVDFAVLAPVLPTETHPNAPTLGWQSFGALVENANIPVYGLGGLTRGDLTKVKESGGQGVAGIRAFLI